MSRLTSLKRLAIAALATAGVVAACRAAQPGEAPPLAPRPELGEPTRSNPVPGAPDPLDPPDPGTPGPSVPTEDGGAAPMTPNNPGPVSQIDPPIYRSTEIPLTPKQAPVDAGGPDAGRGSDAGRPDAMAPPDAGPRPDAPIDAGPVDASPRDARVPDARDGGVGFPPNPDASLPPDAVRPMQ